MPESLIQLSNITKVFATDEVETHALSNVSLEIKRGEYVAIKGASGCGKSTLLSIMGLMEAPTSGGLWIENQEISGLNVVRRAGLRNQLIGFIFQNFNLIGDLDILDNVSLPLLYRNICRRERRCIAAELLERVGLGNRTKHLPRQLSGGQQQRAAVARAIIGGPSILLADEPTGNLDSRNGDAIMDLIGEIHAAGTTVCLVSHDPRYDTTATSQIEMFDGSVVGT